jgi:hypothetical protein
MKLKSVYMLSGVKVVSGKGKNTNTAHPGDIYEIDDARGARHIEDGIAVDVNEPIDGEASSGANVTAVTTGDPAMNIGDTTSNKPLTKAQQKAAAKAAEAAAKAAAAADGTEDDLGLGDPDDGVADQVE